MPPKKPRHSEPAPPPRPKKPRQSLPAKSRQTTPKPAVKRRKLGSTVSEDEYSPVSAPPRGRSRTSTSATVRKKHVTIGDGEKEDDDDDEESEEEEDEEVEERVEKPPVKRAKKPAAKDIAKAAAARKSTGQAQPKNPQTETSKGQTKIAQIFTAGRASLDNALEGDSDQATSNIWDRLTDQTSIKPEHIATMRKGTTDRFDGMNALATPLIALLEARAQFRASILEHIENYDKQPTLMRAILQKIDKVQSAAIEAGRRHDAAYQEEKQIIRGGRRWIGWNRTVTR